MILCQCDRCLYADSVGGYPDGEDMFCCQLEDNPLIPFEMNEDTICPCFRVNPYLFEFYYKPLRGKWHACDFTPDAVRKHYSQGHGILIRYQTVEFYCLPDKLNRQIHHRIADRGRTCDGLKWARTPDGRIIVWGC